jgi:adenylylsulfate kinase-like enzyme
VLGTQDPCEAPVNPEVRIDTTKVSAKEAVEMILKLVDEQFT